MTRTCAHLFRYLICLWLGWIGAGGSWSAELEDPVEPEQPAVAQPEPEAPKAVSKKKRTRTRPANTHRSGERVEIGRDVVIGAGETVRELVVVAGNATIDGTVEDSLVVVSGSVRINGEVRRDVVTILGSASLGPGARVGHDVVVVGGHLRVNPTATIEGERRAIVLGPLLPNFTWLQAWLAKGLFLARPFPPQVTWVWISAVLFLLIYLGLAMLFPGSVRACVTTLDAQPIASFFIGILVLVLLGPLLFMLVVSVAGMLVIPFVVCAVLAALVFGKVAVYSYTGQKVGVHIHGRDLSLPLMLLLGAGLFYVVYMVPVLGFAVWAIITVLGLGAVLLAAFSSFRQEQPVTYSPGVAMGTMGMPAPVMPVVTESAPTVPPLLAAGTDIALLPRVGFWRRLAATLLDLVLLGLLLPATHVFFVVIWVAYYVAMWTWRGTSIGGIVMNIKLVRVDGKPVDFGVALVRSLTSFFSAFALFLGFFWAGWDRERQAWHDKIAGTVVVKVPRMSLL